MGPLSSFGITWAPGQDALTVYSERMQKSS